MGKQLVQFNIPGMTARQFDQCWDELHKAGIDIPQGLIHHTACQQGNNWVVVDVWESLEEFNKFGETLMPILKKAGIAEVPPVITPVYFELSGAVHA